MDLLILVVGIVLVWKFSSVLTALATAGRTKSEVMCESVIMDATEERSLMFESFEEKIGDKKIYSHEEILSKLKVK